MIARTRCRWSVSLARSTRSTIGTMYASDLPDPVPVVST